MSARQLTPFLIWIISLALIYSTTLIGDYLVGSDIHLEYYFAQQTLNSGWDSAYPHAYNGALSVTLLAPAIAKIFHLDLYIVFKWIFPFIYSFVPVVLYFIYKKFLSTPQAFIACIFSIIVPTFFIEVTGIAREQIGELCMVLSILFLLNKRWIWFVVAGILTVMAHYSIGYILFFYLLVIGGVYLLFSKQSFIKRITSKLKYIVASISIIGIGLIYLGSVASGVPLDSASYVGASYIDPIQVVNNSSQFSTKPGLSDYLDLTNRDSLVQTAIGLDFMSVSVWGKIFRLSQFAIEILTVIGCWIAFKKRKELGLELTGLLLASGLILLACVLIPSFASILNPSRFYHLAMLFLPIAIVLGMVIITKYWKVSLAVLAIVYFSFTSGVIFESLKLQPSEVVLPYSLALSHDRLDIGTKYTDTDIDAGEWLKNNADKPVYADIYGLLIIQENMGLIPLYLVSQEIPDDSYIFLRSYNNDTQSLTIWLGAGLREYKSYLDFNLQSILEGRSIIWQSENSIIYSPR